MGKIFKHLNKKDSVVHKDMKRCLKPLVIREMQNNILIRYHYICIEMNKI